MRGSWVVDARFPLLVCLRKLLHLLSSGVQDSRTFSKCLLLGQDFQVDGERVILPAGLHVGNLLLSLSHYGFPRG